MGSVRAASVVVCILLATTTGCGDDSSTGDEDTRPTSPTRAEYIEQADALCEKGNAELDAAASAFFADKPHPTAAQEQTYATTIYVPQLEAVIGELRELQVPEGDEAEVTAFYDAAAAGLAEIAADPSSFGGEPPEGFQEATRLAADYGFEVCGT